MISYLRVPLKAAEHRRTPKHLRLATP